MTYSALLKLAKANGFSVALGNWGYWTNVVYLNNTAIAFSVFEGTTSGILFENALPKFVTKEYIINAVKAGATHLGHCDGNYKPFINGYKKWYKYNDLGGVLCNGF